MKLLLVEDNARLAHDILQFQQESGFVVEHAATLREATEKIVAYQYDLIIVDLGLPDGNGLELVRELKQKRSESGILVLTAKNALADKIAGLDLGADDYMTKPFHNTELNARIRSILRRKKFRGSNTIEFDDITLDLLATQVYIKNTPVSLTKKEYDLLLYFLQNPGRILTKENIAEHLWGDHIDQADNFDFIYNHIKNLRKKITSAGGKNCIQAMYGIGYRLSAPSH